MKDISASVRESVIALSQHTTKSQREIAADLGISQNAVSLIIRRFRTSGSSQTDRVGKCGRKPKLTEKDKRTLIRKSTINPRLSANQLKSDLSLAGVIVCLAYLSKSSSC